MRLPYVSAPAPVACAGGVSLGVGVAPVVGGIYGVADVLELNGAYEEGNAELEEYGMLEE